MHPTEYPSARTHKRASRPGFTILEIMLAVMVTAVVLTMGVVLFRGFKSQRALEDRMSAIEGLARTAYTGVLEDQRPWMVVFEKNRCGVFNIGALPPEDAPLPKPIRVVELDSGMKLFLKRTTWPEWKEIVVPEVWRFEPKSILEPILIRLESPKGFISGRFDPLTARLVDTEMEAN
jgi:hypothetical protein